MAETVRGLTGEMGEQRGDVFRALAQRRQLDLDRAEVRQLERPRGGHDHTHVHLAGLTAAGASHLSLFQHPDQPSLELGREGADLVEEQGALACRLEDAGVIGGSPTA